MNDNETRQEKIRVLMEHITRNIKQYVYDNGAMDLWKTTDPKRMDDFWNLSSWLDHCCAFYIDDKIPWDRELTTQIEVIQSSPDSDPVSVPIKHYDPRPSVMSAARDFFVFVVLQ